VAPATEPSPQKKKVLGGVSIYNFRGDATAEVLDKQRKRKPLNSKISLPKGYIPYQDWIPIR